MMQFPNKQVLAALREKYPAGTKIYPAPYERPLSRAGGYDWNGTVCG